MTRNFETRCAALSFAATVHSDVTDDAAHSRCARAKVKAVLRQSSRAYNYNSFRFCNQAYWQSGVIGVGCDACAIPPTIDGDENQYDSERQD